MAHVDGSALASVACTCSELRDIAHDQILWKVLSFQNRCVLSRILDGIPEAVDIFKHGLVDSSWEMIADEREKLFLNCPFKLGVLGVKDEDSDERLASPLSPLNGARKSREDHCKKLIEDLKLSRILVDKKTGKAVNLLSWQSLSNTQELALSS
ncbi:hypothetical protein Peur_060600 [Populus x canadensis]